MFESGIDSILDLRSDAVSPVSVCAVDVVIRPTELEYGIYRDAYREFADALEAEGIGARVIAPTERRGALTHSAVDVAIYLLDHTTDAVVDLVIAKALLTLGKAKFGKKPRPPRKAAVFDYEKMPHEFELPSHTELDD